MRWANVAGPFYGVPLLARYEYKVLYALPPGHRVGPLASREMKDQMLDTGRLERELNTLGEQGWEVISSAGGSIGAFFIWSSYTLIVLRRERA